MYRYCCGCQMAVVFYSLDPPHSWDLHRATTDRTRLFANTKLAENEI